MSSISLQVTSGLGNLTRSKTVTDAHLTRLVAAYQAEANASINGTATNAQVITYIWNNAVSQWIAKVKAYEDSQAAEAAVAAVTKISITD
jgi:hypothetical protein